MSILIYIILKKAYPYFDSTQEALDSVNKVVRENISGKRLIKVMHTEVEENKKFRKANKKLLEQNIKAMQTVTRVSPVMMLFIYILTYFVLLFGKNGMLEIGNLMAVLQYLTIMLTSLLMGAMLLLLCSQIGVSLKRVVSICNMPSYDRKEGTLPFQNNNLILKNVSFSYGENTKEALKNINIEIKKGERVAVVGRCGSGKTTLLKMMAGFYLPDKGEVLLGNQSLFAYQNMREKMIYNSQKMVFFKGTIKENILWFQKEKIDKSILKISKVDSILSKKEQGLSSSIEAFGSNLSGGEKNRISLARCLNRDFEVLLLDDSLSAVDLKTERKILNSLFAHSKGKTIIYATSRLTFLEKMDKIIVLEKGKIEACGTLEEVLGNSLFQELYALAKEVQNGR
jgi:ATP-binding cassette subfamily B protein